jgi:hypothetical protein
VTRSVVGSALLAAWGRGAGAEEEEVESAGRRLPDQVPDDGNFMVAIGTGDDAGGAGRVFAREEEGVEAAGSEARDEEGRGWGEQGDHGAEGGALLCRDHYCHFDINVF